MGVTPFCRQLSLIDRQKGEEMELKKLIYEVQDGIAVITMNYPKNLNAIDEQMADELMYVVDAAEKDENVKVVILKGLEKAFSAGGDIGYFYELIQAGGEVNMDGLISKVGVVADGMNKAIGTARTMELAATGRPLKADEAKALGLAYQVTTKEELDEVTMAFAKKLAAGPLLSYKNIKKQIYDATYSDYKKWLDETEVPTQRECAASMDFQEGCKAFIEKRKAVFEGK
jgi:trans-2-decenoyl-[acyl-carrier protein] isomerase